MASWQSPGLRPARPLTVTLAPRAQLGARPGLGGRREPGPGLGLEEGWKQQHRLWTACRSAADLGNVAHLSWWAGTEQPAPGTNRPSHSHWHRCPVCLVGLGQCPLLSAGAAHSPQSQGVSLSLGQALAGRLTARTGPAPTATTASWLPPLAPPCPLPSRPHQCWE